MKIIGASGDAPRRIVWLAVKEIHSRAINLSSADADGFTATMRFSIVTDGEELAPRTYLVEELPSVEAGEVLEIDAGGCEVLYDPRVVPVERAALGMWRSLWRDWIDALEDVECDEVVTTYLDEGVAALSGLGPGLTPAGDDFIAGWLTAHRAVGCEASRRAVKGFWDIWGARRDTTWFSTWMIVDAVRGRIWRRGARLLEAMAEGDSNGVRAALDSIAGWGHTSGTAWLAGLGSGFITVLPTASRGLGYKR